MKLKFTTYQGSPCWSSAGPFHYFDADWNTRFPFGTSLCLRIGRRQEDVHQPGCVTDCHCDLPLPTAPGFTLDINAPLDEPNRLYVWSRRRHWMIGLVSWHEMRDKPGQPGWVETVRCRPHLVRGQAWDRRECSWTVPPRWRWIVVSPADWRDRWAVAHPDEAAASEARRAKWKARRST